MQCSGQAAGSVDHPFTCMFVELKFETPTDRDRPISIAASIPATAMALNTNAVPALTDVGAREPPQQKTCALPPPHVDMRHPFSV